MGYLEQEGSSGGRVDFCPMEVGDGMRGKGAVLGRS